MHQHRSTEQGDHQHDAHSCDGADHHEGSDHDGGETNSGHRPFGRDGSIGIHAEKHQIAVGQAQKHQQRDGCHGGANQVCLVGGQKVAEQQRFQINPRLQQGHHQHAKGGESGQNSVHGTFLAPFEALVESFRQQRPEQSADQAADGWVEFEGQRQDQARQDRMGHQIGQQDAPLGDQQ